MLTPPTPLNSGCFVQFAFDNADFNINTIDGKNTLHSMAGIRIVTPKDCFQEKQKIYRHTKRPTAMELSKIEKIPFINYENFNKLPNTSIIIKNIKIPKFDNTNISIADLLWLYGKSEFESIPGWNVFMMKLTENLPFQQSRIICLPLVNGPTSDHNTIYTVLKYAINIAKEQKVATCFVTFDQPLFQKSFVMIKACSDDNEVSKIKVRLECVASLYDEHIPNRENMSTIGFEPNFVCNITAKPNCSGDKKDWTYCT